MISIKGKSLLAFANDIADGYATVNALVLKPLDAESLKGLYHQIIKLQNQIRGEKFHFNEIDVIRTRNLRLQRLHSAVFVIRNFARERGIKQL
ncbi:MAG: hypothetical protein HZC11_01290 [Nitrospirae bacterium]|nr:hypothetical protein [Nitrospirota bacterium]